MVLVPEAEQKKIESQVPLCLSPWDLGQGTSSFQSPVWASRLHCRDGLFTLCLPSVSTIIIFHVCLNMLGSTALGARPLRLKLLQVQMTGS